MSDRDEYLLDTNILSETRRKKADSGVISFLQSADPSTLYISVLALGELRKGVAAKKRTDPASARLLASWVDGLELSFADRLVHIDSAIARQWGEWSSDRPRPVIDTLMAATAAVRGLILVTRNVHDFRGVKVRLLNPFTD